MHMDAAARARLSAPPCLDKLASHLRPSATDFLSLHLTVTLPQKSRNRTLTMPHRAVGWAEPVRRVMTSLQPPLLRQPDEMAALAWELGFLYLKSAASGARCATGRKHAERKEGLPGQSEHLTCVFPGTQG